MAVDSIVRAVEFWRLGQKAELWGGEGFITGAEVSTRSCLGRSGLVNPHSYRKRRYLLARLATGATGASTSVFRSSCSRRGLCRCSPCRTLLPACAIATAAPGALCTRPRSSKWWYSRCSCTRPWDGAGSSPTSRWLGGKLCLLGVDCTRRVWESKMDEHRGSHESEKVG